MYLYFIQDWKFNLINVQILRLNYFIILWIIQITIFIFVVFITWFHKNNQTQTIDKFITDLCLDPLYIDRDASLKQDAKK